MQCEYVAPDSSALKQHMNSVHSGTWVLKIHGSEYMIPDPRLFRPPGYEKLDRDLQPLYPFDLSIQQRLFK